MLKGLVYIMQTLVLILLNVTDRQAQTQWHVMLKLPVLTRYSS
jgi:hypothetical protein